MRIYDQSGAVSAGCVAAAYVVVGGVDGSATGYALALPRLVGSTWPWPLRVNTGRMHEGNCVLEVNGSASAVPAARLARFDAAISRADDLAARQTLRFPFHVRTREVDTGANSGGLHDRPGRLNVDPLTRAVGARVATVAHVVQGRGDFSCTAGAARSPRCFTARIVLQRDCACSDHHYLCCLLRDPAGQASANLAAVPTSAPTLLDGVVPRDNLLATSQAPAPPSRLVEPRVRFQRLQPRLVHHLRGFFGIDASSRATHSRTTESARPGTPAYGLEPRRHLLAARQATAPPRRMSARVGLQWLHSRSPHHGGGLIVRDLSRHGGTIA
ncbi:hypothetical protein J2S55_004138 [Streptosporangium brasiliense]|uniref:Uncharacterized protein n=1 Tax=Streptosporangium brasiliense TaxID=47480 RepID=A0ABT9R6K2_9ACTN|nr:hypothetical protein [Streptosporangium brasiliense]